MAIVGAHVLLYTSEAERLRETLRDVLGWDSVEGHDPPDGWLIFKLPPAELGVHPGETPKHEFTLMCDDLNSTMAELGEKGIEFRGEARDQGFGIVTTMLLPGGIEVLLYEPKHNSPLDLQSSKGRGGEQRELRECSGMTPEPTVHETANDSDDSPADGIQGDHAD